MTAMNSSQDGSQLAQLPAELLTRITRWVTTPEINAVRATCKLVEQKLFSTWSSEFFKKRQFMVSTFSLNALLGIAKDPRLGRVLKHVIITTNRFRQRPGYTGSDETRFALSRARCDQDFLLQTGAWIDILADALSSLPNLETIDIRDFDSKTRFRDGPNAQWYAYGSTTEAELGNMRPDSTDYNVPNFVDTIFRGVVAAAVRSGTTAANLEVIVRHSGLSDAALYVHPTVKASYARYLAGLRKLHLVLARTDAHLNGFPNLQTFLHMTPNVSWLRFNLIVNPGDIFLDWFGLPAKSASSPKDSDDKDGSSALPSYCAPPVSLPKLESLELGLFATTPEKLQAVLDKYPLRSLTLWKMVFGDLLNDDVAAVPLSEADSGWAKFVTSLADTGVRRLMIGHAAEADGYNRKFRHVLFKGGRDPRILNLPCRRYTEDMFVNAAKDIELEPVPQRSSSTSDSRTGSSDEDDDDDGSSEDDGDDADGDDGHDNVGDNSDGPADDLD